MVVVQFALIPLILASLNLLGMNLGPVSPFSSRVLGVFCLALAWLLLAGTGKVTLKPASRVQWFAGVGALASVVVMFLTLERGVWLACLAVHVHCLGRLLCNSHDLRRSLHAASTAIVFSLLLFLLVHHVPEAWSQVHSGAMAFSRRIGAMFGSNVVQGPSTAGFAILISFLVYVAARGSLAGSRSLPVSIAGLVILVVLFVLQTAWGPVAAVWFFTRLARWTMANPFMGSPPQLESAMPATYAPLLLLLAGSLLIFLLEWIWANLAAESGESSRDAQTGCASWPFVAVGTVVSIAAFGALMLSSTARAASPSSSRVVFYTDPENRLRQFDEPNFEHLGLASAGMFGSVLRYLESWGFQPHLLDPGRETLDEVLSDCGVFVVINPTRVFPTEQKQAIWRFVESGGSLLVLGDHTDIGGSMDKLDDLLSPVGITFNFDSAFTATHWVNVCEAFPHPITAGLDLQNEKLRHSTGASLNIPPGVSPVVVARWAFSDVGNRSNAENAFLGDYAYSFREELSDMVIVAEKAYGRGKVLVFGDTSAFQNNAVAHSSPFVAKVFRYLAATPGRRAVFGYAGGALLVPAALLTSSLGAWAFRRRLPLPAFLVPAVVLMLPPPGLPVSPAAQDARPTALLDAAHVNRFSLAPWEDRSADGLLVNLARSGYLPELLLDRRDLGRLQDARLFAVIAPSEPFTPRELQAVNEFMEAGGLVVLSVGFEEKAGAAGLLDLLQVDLSDVPLGPIPIEPPGPAQAMFTEALQRPHFREAWPVINKSQTPLEVFYREGLYDIMVFRGVGRGGALIVGDSWFFHDKVLETEKAWWPGNINLIRSLLSTLRSRGIGA